MKFPQPKGPQAGQGPECALRVPLHAANGSRQRDLGTLYDGGHLRPVIDKTFPFDETVEAMAYVEQGHTKAGKVVVALAPGE